MSDLPDDPHAPTVAAGEVEGGLETRGVESTGLSPDRLVGVGAREAAEPDGLAELELEKLGIDETLPVDASATRRRLGPMFWVAIGWLVLVVFAAIWAPRLGLKNPESPGADPDLGFPPYKPSSSFWFGTDQLGQDMFSRCIYGARISLVVGFSAILFGLIVGGTLGITAGYFRGWWDKIVSFAFLALLSFPSLVLAVLITSLVEKRTLTTISLVIGVLSVAPIGRLARATTIQFADREFVVAARALGASNMRIIVRELLPNVVIPMGALALLGMSVAIIGEGSLAFLGLSVSDGLSWGTLIALGADSGTLQSSPWVAFAPITMLFLTVAALNFAGDKIRQYFDVRESAL